MMMQADLPRGNQSSRYTYSVIVDLPIINGKYEILYEILVLIAYAQMPLVYCPAVVSIDARSNFVLSLHLQPYFIYASS